MLRTRAGHLLWAAVLLPPKVEELSLDWQKDLRPLPQVRARAVVPLNSEPLLHGGLRWSSRSPGRIETLTATGDTIEERALPTGVPVQRRAAAAGEAASFGRSGPSQARAPFRVQGDVLEYRPPGSDRMYWSIPLGGPLTREGWAETTKSWYGFSAERREIYWLSSPYTRFYRTRWVEDAETVTFLPCDSARAVLVEHLPQGLTRFFFFRAGRPFAYTIFRLAPEGADVSAVLARGCDEFYVGGSFGLRRIEYSRW